MEIIYDHENNKTRVKLSNKEYKRVDYILWLHAKGFDAQSPIKQSSRYIYFKRNGLLNPL